MHFANINHRPTPFSRLVNMVWIHIKYRIFSIVNRIKKGKKANKPSPSTNATYIIRQNGYSDNITNMTPLPKTIVC